MLTALNTDLKSVPTAVVGGGLMGHALAAIFVSAGHATTVCETSRETRAGLLGKIGALLSDWQRDAQALNLLRVVDAVDQILPETGIVVEAVPENLDLKRKLFSELAYLLPSAILATNSSVFRVGDVAAQARDPERVIGTHWWNPPHLIPVVEVIQGERTSPKVVNWTIDFLAALGKTPVHVRKDTPGFIGNRLQHALWREAFALVEEGVADAETVDLVARNTIGLKLAVMGPLENADYVGLDMTHAIHHYVFPALSRSDFPSALLDSAIASGELGAKSGKGLMEWPEGRRRGLSEKLSAHVSAQVGNREAVPARGER